MKLFRYSILAAIGAMMLSACDKELSGTDWQPGEQSSAPGVYFSPENESFITLLGDDNTATLKVKRIDSNGALTVPVIVKGCDENMVVPKEIKFADGQDETTLAVDCSNVPSIISLPLQLTFPDEFVNPYAAGSAEYIGSVIVSRWENVSDTGTLDFRLVGWSNSDDVGYEPIKSEMYKLLGSERYRIKNFLNTGIDFTFDLMESPYKAGYYRIMPVKNQLLLADYGMGDYSYYNSWWLVTDDYDSEDEDVDGWPNVVFTKADGSMLDIYYCQFFWYDDTTKSEYCYVYNYDKGTPVAYMCIMGNLDEDMETWTGYYRVRFAWKENREQ